MPPSASSIRVVPSAEQAVAGVGKYRYIAMLAEGGMADVYLAVTQSAGFEKLVVIKQLRESLAEDPSFVTMFMDEARLAARLNHPNVVQTLEVGTDERTGIHFIAMEFLEGVAHVKLARLKERVPPPLAFHVRVLVDVLRGLHYAHELCDFDGTRLNVVHRDVSPQNVMLTFEGGVKVLDFGIAKAALAAEQRPEDFKGKLEYMAPEQARLGDVDRRADVFSVGVMLFEALARRRLYRKGENKLTMLINGRLPKVSDVAPSTPRKLAAICGKAMAHDRDARYPTAEAMAEDLEEWLGDTTQHVTAREVGAYVAERFASTRAKIRAAIEAQLALFQQLPRESSPDTSPLSRLPGATDPPPQVHQADAPTTELDPPTLSIASLPHPVPSSDNAGFETTVATTVYKRGSPTGAPLPAAGAPPPAGPAPLVPRPFMAAPPPIDDSRDDETMARPAGALGPAATASAFDAIPRAIHPQTSPQASYAPATTRSAPRPEPPDSAPLLELLPKASKSFDGFDLPPAGPISPVLGPMPGMPALPMPKPSAPSAPDVFSPPAPPPVSHAELPGFGPPAERSVEVADAPFSLAAPPPAPPPAPLAVGSTASAWSAGDVHGARRAAPASSGKILLFLGAGMAALLLVAGIVVVVATKGKERAMAAASASASAPAAPSAEVAAATSAPAASATAGSSGGATEAEAAIEYTIRASPPSAKIFLDGMALPANPATGKRSRDSGLHALRIEAAGHDTREESITFERSVLINIELKATPTAPEPAATPATAMTKPAARPPHRAAAPHAAPAHPARPHVSKTIDPENPYQ